MADVTEDLLDYEEEEETIQPNSGVQVFQGPHSKKQGVNPDGRADGSTDGEVKEAKKGSYVGVHATGFRDFLLKPELLRAIVDCGFEHPSEGKICSWFYGCISLRQGAVRGVSCGGRALW